MAGSVALVLKTDKARADGRCPVYVRITSDRKSSYIATGVRVDPALWREDKERVRESHDLADAMNARLLKVRNSAEEALLEGKTAKQVKMILTGEGGEVIGFLDQHIHTLEERGQLWEQRKYEVLKRKLVDCLGGEIVWSHLTAEALTRFETYLRTVRKNNANTTAKELSRLRVIVRKAIRRDVLDPGKDPFVRFQIPKGEPIHRRKLSVAEIAALGEATLDGKAELARDIYLFAFFAGGMRFGDVARLRVSDVKEGRVSYTAMKTGKAMSQGVPSNGLRIAERYAEGRTDSQRLFPALDGKPVGDAVSLRRSISSANASLNQRLKAAARVAGVEPEGLTMHVARHSYADLGRRMSGNLHALMQSLGHSKLSVTEAYLKSLDEDEKDELVRDVWSGFDEEVSASA